MGSDVNLHPYFAVGVNDWEDKEVRAATDAVLHYLFRGLGWSSTFHDKFLPPVGTLGVSVVQRPNGDAVDNTVRRCRLTSA